MERQPLRMTQFQPAGANAGRGCAQRAGPKHTQPSTAHTQRTRLAPPGGAAGRCAAAAAPSRPAAACTRQRGPRAHAARSAQAPAAMRCARIAHPASAVRRRCWPQRSGSRAIWPMQRPHAPMQAAPAARALCSSARCQRCVSCVHPCQRLQAALLAATQRRPRHLGQPRPARSNAGSWGARRAQPKHPLPSAAHAACTPWWRQAALLGSARRQPRH